MSSLRIFAVLGWVAALAIAPPAEAQPSANPSPPLTLQPPFDAWCVVPLCRANAEVVARQPLVELSPAALPTDDRGAIEASLAQHLGASIDQLLTRSLGVDEPAADLTHTFAAALAGDRALYGRMNGLGSSLIRVGLVLALERAVSDDLCPPGAPRLNAIYEALALSVSLRPLGFPEATGQVLRVCRPLAETAATRIDQMALGVLVSPELAAAQRRAIDAIRLVQASCGAGEPPMATLVDATPALRALRGTMTPRGAMGVMLWASSSPVLPSGLPAACVGAIQALGPALSASLRATVALGLGDVDASALEQTLGDLRAHGPQLAGARALIEPLLRGRGASRELLQAVLHTLRGRLSTEGDPSALADHVLDALESALAGGGGELGSIDPTRFVAALRDAYGLDETGRPTLRSVLGFGTSPWVFDANAGLPRLTGGELKFIGDLSLGYHAPSFGVVAHGGASYYDIDANGVLTDTLHATGDVRAWGEGALGPGVRGELQVVGGVDYLDSTLLHVPSAAQSLAFGQYDSFLGRATLLLGLRWSPSQEFRLDLRAGGGGQYESHNAVGLSNVASFQATDAFSARGTGHALATWHVLPQWFGLRGLMSGDYFRITRDELSFVSGKTPTVTPTSERQIEGRGRVFFDLDLASFGGFVPAAWLGADLVSLQGGGAGAVTAVVPVVGLGITRP